MAVPILITGVKAVYRPQIILVPSQPKVAALVVTAADAQTGNLMLMGVGN